MKLVMTIYQYLRVTSYNSTKFREQKQFLSFNQAKNYDI
jgi:hypothetical protein